MILQVQKVQLILNRLPLKQFIPRYNMQNYRKQNTGKKSENSQRQRQP